MDASDAGEADRLLRLAVDQIVVAAVGRAPEAPIPVGGVRQRLGWRDGLAAGVSGGWRRPVRDQEGERVRIVHRHPGPHADLEPEHTRGDHRVEGEQEVGDAPVVRVRLRRAIRAVHDAEVRVGHLVPRRAVGERVPGPAVRRHLGGVHAAEVQVHGVAGVDVALQRLHPVAVALVHLDAVVGEHRGLELRHRRRRRPRSQVRPDESAALHTGIGHGPDLLLEVALRRLDGHVDAAAAHVELPAMIDTAQALGFVAAVEEAGAAMRAAVLDQAHGPRRDAERDEVLAQQTHAQRRAVGLGQFARQRGGHPVLPHEVAHRCSRSDPTEQLVVVPTQHGRLRAV